MGHRHTVPGGRGPAGHPQGQGLSLDPVSDQEKELGCKVGFDATKPLGGEGFQRPTIPVSDEVRKILERYAQASKG